MVSRSLILFSGLLAFSLFIGCSSTEETANTPIRIGSVWSLTGPGSALDIPGSKGAALAVQKLNDAGGVLGRTIELVIIDAQSDSSHAASGVANALADHSDIVGLIGLNDSDPAIGAGKQAQLAGLPFITAGATYPKLPEIVGNTIFLACFGDNTQAAAAAEYIFDSLKKRNAFILYNDNTTYTLALRQYFTVRWQELASDIKNSAAYSDGASSLASQIEQIKSAGPDFIYVPAVPEDILNVIRQIRSAGILVPIIGGDGFDTHVLEDSLSTTESDSLYFTTHAYVDASASAAMGAFISDFKSANGTEPQSAFAPLGYDAVMLMAKAIEDAVSTDPAEIRLALEKITSYPTLSGTLTFTSNQHVPHKSVTIMHLRDRHYERAAELLPRRVPAP